MASKIWPEICGSGWRIGTTSPYYARSPERNPQGPKDGVLRVMGGVVVPRSNCSVCPLSQPTQSDTRSFLHRLSLRSGCSEEAVFFNRTFDLGTRESRRALILRRS